MRLSRIRSRRSIQPFSAGPPIRDTLLLSGGAGGSDGGLAHREIAERLVLEDGSIRTHLRNIYRKLGVNSRVAAVRRARELNLLS